MSLIQLQNRGAGEIVVMRGEDDVDDGGAFPFGGEGVYRPPSAAAAQFLHRRKILTVNGTHTTLAFLTLAAKEPPPHKGLPRGDYELVRCIADEADDDFLDAEEAYRQVWCFAVARQLLLFSRATSRSRRRLWPSVTTTLPQR